MAHSTGVPNTIVQQESLTLDRIQTTVAFRRLLGSCCRIVGSQAQCDARATVGLRLLPKGSGNRRTSRYMDASYHKRTECLLVASDPGGCRDVAHHYVAFRSAS